MTAREAHSVGTRSIACREAGPAVHVVMCKRTAPRALLLVLLNPYRSVCPTTCISMTTNSDISLALQAAEVLRAVSGQAKDKVSGTQTSVQKQNQS